MYNSIAAQRATSVERMAQAHSTELLRHMQAPGIEAIAKLHKAADAHAALFVISPMDNDNMHAADNQ